MGIKEAAGEEKVAAFGVDAVEDRETKRNATEDEEGQDDRGKEDQVKRTNLGEEQGKDQDKEEAGKNADGRSMTSDSDSESSSRVSSSEAEDSRRQTKGNRGGQKEEPDGGATAESAKGADDHGRGSPKEEPRGDKAAEDVKNGEGSGRGSPKEQPYGNDAADNANEAEASGRGSPNEQPLDNETAANEKKELYASESEMGKSETNLSSQDGEKEGDTRAENEGMLKDTKTAKETDHDADGINNKNIADKPMNGEQGDRESYDEDARNGAGVKDEDEEKKTVEEDQEKDQEAVISALEAALTTASSPSDKAANDKAAIKDSVDDSSSDSSFSNSDSDSDSDDPRSKSGHRPGTGSENGEDGKKKEIYPAAAAVTTAAVSAKEDTETGTERDDEQETNAQDDLAGGRDPDHVASDRSQQSVHLNSAGVPPGISHSGSIRPLVEGQKDIDLAGIALTKEQVDELAQVMRESGEVNSLILRNSSIEDAGLEALVEALTAAATATSSSSEKDLKMLNLNCNNVTGVGVGHVVSIVQQKPELEILLLHGNPLQDSGVRRLVNGLLDVDESRREVPNPEEQEALKETAKDLVSDVIKKAVHSMDGTASDSPTTSAESSVANDDSVARMVGTLAQEQKSAGLKIRQIDIGDCHMTSSGAEQVARLVAANAGFTTLGLTGNKEVGLEGWLAVAEALKTNAQIQTLSLDYNNLGDVGTEVVAAALMENHAVTSLDLEGNKIGDEGGRKILELLRQNGNIRDVTLMPGNNISAPLLSELKSALKTSDGRV